MNERNVIVSGASILSDDAWPTWKDLLQKTYKLKNLHNVSVKGAGNELIILNAINKAINIENPLILIQLTNVDKWDWYIEDAELIKQINKEKHPIAKLRKDEQHGYWSTGSHFPKWKKYYFDNYFSIEHSMFSTLLNIQYFQQICNKNLWQYQIFFDSPIFSVKESQLNTGKLVNEDFEKPILIENTLCNTLFSSIDITNIYTPGLIGHACLNGIEWFSTKYSVQNIDE